MSGPHNLSKPTPCVRPQVGDVVGYSVKMDSATSRRTRLLFCTTGILMRRLASEPLLGSVSHVVLDEVRGCPCYVVRNMVCGSRSAPLGRTWCWTRCALLGCVRVRDTCVHTIE